VASKRREDYIKLVAAGYDPDDVRNILKGGGSVAGLKARNKPPTAMSQADIAKWFQEDLKIQAESHTKSQEMISPAKRVPFDEVAGMENSKRRFATVMEATSIMSQQGKKGGEGAIPAQPSPGTSGGSAAPSPTKQGSTPMPDPMAGASIPPPSGQTPMVPILGGRSIPSPRGNTVIPEPPKPAATASSMVVEKDKMQKYMQSLASDPQKQKKAQSALQKVKTIIANGGSKPDVDDFLQSNYPEIYADIKKL
jgi:hypothetical protein